MTRRAVIAGNWKMNKTPEEAVKVIKLNIGNAAEFGVNF